MYGEHTRSGDTHFLYTLINAPSLLNLCGTSVTYMIDFLMESHFATGRADLVFVVRVGHYRDLPKSTN